MSGPIEAVDNLLAQWVASRKALHEFEAQDRPDLIDGLGRRWVWKRLDLWLHAGTAECAGVCHPGANHDTFAWPRDFMPEPMEVA